MITRKDVAEKAGVSVATVSYVISGKKYVSSELKHRVNMAIRELNYQPNMIARSLSTKRTNHVGIIVSNISNPYYGEIALGMEKVAHENGYTVSVYSMTGNPDTYMTAALQRQLDGLFLATVSGAFSAEQVKLLAENDIALVNSGIAGIGSTVYFDYEPALDKIVKYLYQLGHKHIAFLSGISAKNTSFERYVSFNRAMERYGLPVEPGTIVDGEYPYLTDQHDGYKAMKKLLASATRVTAVFCLNDMMALGALKAIRDAGLRVPQDISVVGCDDVFFSEFIEPSLTTLRVPKLEMGRTAMLQILNQLREGKVSDVALDIDFIIRDSTGSAPGEEKIP